jgi:tetratricopeptide (TPR) repeat protein
VGEAWRPYRETRDRFGEAQTISALGEECLLLRDYAGALANFEKALNLWREIGDPSGAMEKMYARVGQSLALLDRREEARHAFDRAAAAHSPKQFGWLGWRAVTGGEFEDALVHFTAMTNRDPALAVDIAASLVACANV